VCVCVFVCECVLWSDFCRLIEHFVAAVTVAAVAAAGADAIVAAVAATSAATIAASACS